MDILLQDVRYAARKLLRTPSITIIAITTLALAIGATTAVFSIVNGVLLEPLPFHDPNGVMMLGSTGKDGKMAHLSPPDFVSYRDRTHSFADVAQVMDANSANLSIAGNDPLRLNAADVGAKFFDILGAPMQLGRGFIAGEDGHGAPHVVVLSDKLWRSNFAADPHVLGRSVSLNGDAYTIVGVAPASLTYPSKPDLWIPFELEAWMLDPANRSAHFISGVARLKAGVAEETARRDMAAVGEQLRAEFPTSNTNFGGTAESLQRALTGDVRRPLFVMFGAVAFVLLIACANVANLLLVRASGRETEMALRTALGAHRGRIVRQLVTESLLLSAGGAMIGGALAAWAIDAVVAFGPKGLPRLEEVTVDARVLGFSVIVALVTGLAFGLVPALHSARTELGQMLKEGMRGASGRRATQRTRGMLVMTEMALAVVLLVGSGLLIRSFMKILDVDPGFQPEHIVSFSVSVPAKKYPYDRDIRRFAAQVVAGLSPMPGTAAVAVTNGRPMEGGMRTSIQIEGRPPAPASKVMLADVRPASANFFSTMGMRVLQGRVFTTEEENFGPPTVVVITRALAKKYFPNEDPVGKRITVGVSHDTGSTGVSLTTGGQIVGVIADVHNQALNQDANPTVYVGWGTLPFNDISLLVRSTAKTSTVAAEIRERVRAVDAEMPVYELHTMSEVLSDSIAQPRFYMILLTAFAGLALLLAALGIYGVISYTVSQRTRELGIRIALGATHDRVVRLVLRQGLTLTIAGIGAGLMGAFWLVHLLSALLYGVSANDGLTFGGVAVVLVAVATVASYLPARRAARVDPVIAMRAD